MPRMYKAQPQGVLSSDRQTLSAAQRQEYFRLVNKGVDEVTARALAMVMAKNSGKDWLKKNKPLGAAFSHGRKEAKEKGGGKKKAKQAANAYLRRQGHEPMAKAEFEEGKHPRGKDGKFGEGGGEAKAKPNPALAAKHAEKLQAAVEAKDPVAIAYHARAMAHYQPGTKPMKKNDDLALALVALEKSHYHEKFVEAAKELLPKFYLDQAHKRARASAGGKASGAARNQAAGTQKALEALNDRHAELKAQLEQVAQDIANHPYSQPTDDSTDLALSLISAPEDSAASMAKSEQSPPAGVRSACRRGLALAPEYGGAGLTAGAKARAKAMAAGQPVSEQNLKRMKSFFARHSSYEKETNPPSPGYVSWLLWGGDAGKRWSEGQVAKLEKAIIPAAQVHVDTPLGSQKRKKKRPAKALEKSVYSPQAEHPPGIEADPQLPQDEKIRNAARLVAGMDMERWLGAENDDDARQRASRQLATSLGHYDNRFIKDDALRGVKGLDLDLGSGQARQPGYLGLDLYPYDYGTAVHDLTLGIPVADQGARSIRLVNALSAMPDYAADATPLLQEIQRALNYGGQLFYEGRGDLQDKANWDLLPGLVLVDHEDSLPLVPSQAASTTDLTKQRFERVRVRVPQIYGADPTWLGAQEGVADDLAYAMAAMGGNVPTDRMMEGLINQQAVYVPAMMDQAPPPPPADKQWQQLLYCVVYAPHELDSDGEYMEPEEIADMAHNAMREGLEVKIDHQGDPIDADVVESFIAPAEITMTGVNGPQVIPAGAWVAGISVRDPVVWQGILSGKYRGISAGGQVLTEER